ncbi:hypothetical protein B484DRAFT_395920, partial [Ochromonadaceae sp. CCMP2298]
MTDTSQSQRQETLRAELGHLVAREQSSHCAYLGSRCTLQDVWDRLVLLRGRVVDMEREGVGAQVEVELEGMQGRGVQRQEIEHIRGQGMQGLRGKLFLRAELRAEAEELRGRASDAQRRLASLTQMMHATASPTPSQTPISGYISAPVPFPSSSISTSISTSTPVSGSLTISSNLTPVPASTPSMAHSMQLRGQLLTLSASLLQWEERRAELGRGLARVEQELGALLRGGVGGLGVGVGVDMSTDMGGGMGVGMGMIGAVSASFPFSNTIAEALLHLRTATSDMGRLAGLWTLDFQIQGQFLAQLRGAKGLRDAYREGEVQRLRAELQLSQALTRAQIEARAQASRVSVSFAEEGAEEGAPEGTKPGKGMSVGMGQGRWDSGAVVVTPQKPPSSSNHSTSTRTLTSTHTPAITSSIGTRTSTSPNPSLSAAHLFQEHSALAALVLASVVRKAQASQHMQDAGAGVGGTAFDLTPLASLPAPVPGPPASGEVGSLLFRNVDLQRAVLQLLRERQLPPERHYAGVVRAAKEQALELLLERDSGGQGMGSGQEQGHVGARAEVEYDSYLTALLLRDEEADEAEEAEEAEAEAGVVVGWGVDAQSAVGWVHAAAALSENYVEGTTAPCASASASVSISASSASASSAPVPTISGHSGRNFLDLSQSSELGQGKQGDKGQGGQGEQRQGAHHRFRRTCICEACVLGALYGEPLDGYSYNTRYSRHGHRLLEEQGEQMVLGLGMEDDQGMAQQQQQQQQAQEQQTQQQ